MAKSTSNCRGTTAEATRGALLYLSSRFGEPLLVDQAVSDALAQPERARLLESHPKISVGAAREFHVRLTNCFEHVASGCWGALWSKRAAVKTETDQDDTCLGDRARLAQLDPAVRREKIIACFDQRSASSTLLGQLVMPGALHREAFINRVLEAAITPQDGTMVWSNPWLTSTLKLSVEGDQLVIDELAFVTGC